MKELRKRDRDAQQLRVSGILFLTSLPDEHTRRVLILGYHYAIFNPHRHHVADPFFSERMKPASPRTGKRRHGSVTMLTTTSCRKRMLPSPAIKIAERTFSTISSRAAMIRCEKRSHCGSRRVMAGRHRCMLSFNMWMLWLKASKVIVLMRTSSCVLQRLAFQSLTEITQPTALSQYSSPSPLYPGSTTQAAGF